MLFMIIFLTLFRHTLSNDVLKYTIEEKLPINTFLIDLSKELNIKTNAYYQIDELLTKNNNLFSINNQTGHLFTRSFIDREQMCLKQQCSCNLCEIFLQLNIYLQEKILYKIIEIKIKDRNDHSPNFDKQSMIHIIHIKENVPLGYRIVLPSANDPDEGLNSVQSYRLDGINGDDFDIDLSSYNMPYLVVRSSLDCQRTSTYSLTLIASDQGEPIRSNSIQLSIRILNITQSVPTFMQSVYNIDIREDTLIGTNILKVEAISDDNEKIFYELLNDSPFVIDRLTGQIQLGQMLDYEKQTSYQLTVKAYENSIPTYASIVLRVIDINDNPVSMNIHVQGNATLKIKENDKYVVFIQENTPVGTTIGHIILNDLDSYTNGNPYLQIQTIDSPLPLIYKLIYQNKFHNLKYYSLILNQNLDREQKSIYDNMKLISYDSGTPTLNTQLSFVLNLTDINDCVPQIRIHSTIYNINENNPIGYIIDKLNVYDCDVDENARIEYRLLNKTDLLLINSTTGEISLNKTIDFDILNKNQNKSLKTIDFDFLIEVSDHGQPQLSSQTKIILRIHDINDHSPSFDENQSFNWTFFQSALQLGSVLGRINARDNDSGLNGLIRYSIRSVDSCLSLQITPIGYVYIPYETTTLSCLSSPSSHTFEIIASDYDSISPRSASQTLTIQINSDLTNHLILPKLLPLSSSRTIVDINNQGNISFILDITTFNNYTYQPMIYLNNTHLSSCWHVSPTGEIRLISHPYASSYILTLFVLDEYTNDNLSIKYQVDLCNSTILNSCQAFNISDNRMILIYAICLALIITSIFIILFSIFICICCRKTNHKKNQMLSTMNQQSFLQYTDESQSEKTENSSNRYKRNSANSFIRDDDHDSACIINVPSSSSTSTSSGILTKTDTTLSMYPLSSAYHYDLKLAELLRTNQHPPCVYLNELPQNPHSISTDYGFSSLELSLSSSSSSTIPSHYLEQTIERQLNMKSFISSRECVV